MHVPQAIHHACPLQALFWARTYNWRFADWRDDNFAELANSHATCPLHHGPAPRNDADGYAADDDAPVPNPANHDCSSDSPSHGCAGSACHECRTSSSRRAAIDRGEPPCHACRLYDALEEEAGVDENDYVRFMAGYYRRMDPTQTAKACGSCGVSDVPAEGLSEADSEAIGIVSFTRVQLPNVTQRGSSHTCAGKCRRDCPFLLEPLEYTTAELDAYNADYPSHILPPSALEGSALDAWRDEQRRDWTDFRRVVSNVALDNSGHAVSRVGFSSVDAGGRPISVDITGSELTGKRTPRITSPETPPALRLHLYPEVCAANETHLCGPCMRSLLARRRPEPSIAAGWDLGTPAYADMPTLSWAEKRAISKTRILCTAFNIDAPKKSGE